MPSRMPEKTTAKEKREKGSVQTVQTFLKGNIEAESLYSVQALSSVYKLCVQGTLYREVCTACTGAVLHKLCPKLVQALESLRDIASVKNGSF